MTRRRPSALVALLVLVGCGGGITTGPRPIDDVVQDGRADTCPFLSVAEVTAVTSAELDAGVDRVQGAGDPDERIQLCVFSDGERARLDVTVRVMTPAEVTAYADTMAELGEPELRAARDRLAAGEIVPLPRMAIRFVDDLVVAVTPGVFDAGGPFDELGGTADATSEQLLTVAEVVDPLVRQRVHAG